MDRIPQLRSVKTGLMIQRIIDRCRSVGEMSKFREVKLKLLVKLHNRFIDMEKRQYAKETREFEDNALLTRMDIHEGKIPNLVMDRPSISYP